MLRGTDNGNFLDGTRDDIDTIGLYATGGSTLSTDCNDTITITSLFVI